MKVICEECGRQIVDYIMRGDKYLAPLPMYPTFHGSAICGECGSDLDENGLHPDEKLAEGQK